MFFHKLFYSLKLKHLFLTSQTLFILVDCRPGCAITPRNKSTLNHIYFTFSYYPGKLVWVFRVAIRLILHTIILSHVYCANNPQLGNSCLLKQYSFARRYCTIKQIFARYCNHPNPRQHIIYFKWSAAFRMPLQIRLEIIQLLCKHPTNLPSVWLFYLIFRNLNNLRLFSSQFNLCFLDIYLELLSIYLRILEELGEDFLLPRRLVQLCYSICKDNVAVGL